MQPPLKIAFANTSIGEAIAKLEALGCTVESHDYSNDAMAARSVLVELNGVQPMLPAWVMQPAGEEEAWLVYWPSNRTETLGKWLRLPLAPILGLMEMFTPEKPYVPTEDERRLREAQSQIEESLKSDPGFAGFECYYGKLPG